jgi:hypothetical protein
MPPSHDDNLDEQIGVRVPADLDTATDKIADLRNYQVGPNESFYKSHAVREALEVYFYLLASAEELPEEIEDILDADLSANAGEGGIPRPDLFEELGVHLKFGGAGDPEVRRAVKA